MIAVSDSLGLRPGAYMVDREGTVWSNLKNGRLKPGPGKDGYVRYGLMSNEGQKVMRTAHRIVAETFIGPLPTGLIIDHRDRNRSNNNAENLRYITASENNANRTTAQSTGKGRKVEQLGMDGELIKVWDSITQAENELSINNVWQCCMSKIRSAGDTTKHPHWKMRHGNSTSAGCKFPVLVALSFQMEELLMAARIHRATM
jgi:hypothetical protein